MKKGFLHVFLLLGSACSFPQTEAVPDVLLESRTEQLSEIEENVFSIYGGETARHITHKLLISVKEVEDSRCPADVQCIWAGMASTKLSIQSQLPPLQIKDLNLCLGCTTGENDSVQFEMGSLPYLLVLKEVKPYPVSGQTNKDTKKSAGFSLTQLE